jgi:hypothetical protein
VAIFGALLLVFIILIRPQEFIPALQSLSLLNVAVGIAFVGILIEVGTGKLKSFRTPQLPIVAMFWGWALVSAVVKCGLGSWVLITSLSFSVIFMFVVLYASTTFERLRVMTVMLLAIAIALSVIGAEQASSPFECIALEVDENGEIAADRSIGESNGLSCESGWECNKQTGDFKTEFLCEKPGPFRTFSVGHGRVRWRGTLADPNEMSLAIGAALSFAFALHASAKGKLRHILLLGTVAVATYCVVETESRGGVLVLLAIFGTYFVRRYGLRGFILAAALGAPVLLLGGRSGEEAEASSLERLGALYVGVDFFRGSPIFGIGLAQFTEHYFITAHNSYVLSAAELGFPGMLLWTSLVYVSMKIPYVIATRPPAGLDPRLVPYAFAILTSFAGILVGIFFLSFCYHAMLFIYLGLSGALYLAARRSAPQFEVKVGRKEIGLLAAVDVGLLAFLFVYTRIKGAGD